MIADDSTLECKRDDKDVAKCLIKAFDTLKPHLVTGLKELQVDPLDPLVLSHKFTMHEVNKEIASYNLKIDNLIMTGLRNLEISSVDADPGKYFAVEVYLPNITTNFSFDVVGVLKNQSISSAGSIIVDFGKLSMSSDCFSLHLNISTYLNKKTI